MMQRGLRHTLTLFAWCMATILVAVSCCRRDMYDEETGVYLRLKVKVQVKNSTNALPELMEVAFFEPDTHKLVWSEFIGPEGGFIHVGAGTYDMLVYNIDTESTILRNKGDHNTIEAYTNEVSRNLRDRFSRFLAARQAAAEAAAKAAAEEAAKAAAEGTTDESADGGNGGADNGGDGDSTAGTTDNSGNVLVVPVEKVVYEPDHLYVAREMGLTIPVRCRNEITVVETEAESVVETWRFRVENIKGMQYVDSASALLTGMVESNYIGPNRRSENPVSIYFEVAPNRENNTLNATFNTFGKLSGVKSEVYLDILITDTDGAEYEYYYDVTDQFRNNDDMTIVVDGDIDIPEPAAGGGGLAPKVDEWDDVNKTIEL